MIVAFSSSSPVVSVALLSEDGAVLYSSESESRVNASGVSIELLKQGLDATGATLGEASLFCADLGPGSFIGGRVCVTLAKMLAFTHGAHTAGASSFDLIDQERTVVLPSKKGEFFIRAPGDVPFRSKVLPTNQSFVGYGHGCGNESYPKAESFSSLLNRIERVVPEHLVPEYLIEPSISSPKRPYGPEVIH